MPAQVQLQELFCLFCMRAIKTNKQNYTIQQTSKEDKRLCYVCCTIEPSACAAWGSELAIKTYEQKGLWSKAMLCHKLHSDLHLLWDVNHGQRDPNSGPANARLHGRF